MKKRYNFILSLKGIASTLLLVFLFFSSKTLNAQTINTVNVSVTITPPYSPFYSDYAGPNAAKVLLVLTNTSATQQTIKLVGQLEGDNGIKISTRSNYIPNAPIILNPRESKQLNGLALKDIFDLNSLNVYGIDKSRLIYTSRLPEGNYSFCIQAVSMTNNQVVSANAPLGCTTITIAYPDAPVLVDPMANLTVTPTNPQSQNFAWINPGFVPVNTVYLLQIAEMPLTNADPNQVLNSTSLPSINKRVFGTTARLSALDLSLKVGKRYAWRVKAYDPTGKIVFKNDGISQALQFRYGNEIKIASIITPETPGNNQKVENFSKLVFAWKFTDNSADSDPINLGGLGQMASFNRNLFRLHITRIKNADELAKEKVAKLANIKYVVKNDEIVVDVNAKAISYTNSALISGFLKDKNNYRWYVEHPATTTKSETQYFTVQFPKILTDYKIQLAGRLKYRYYDDYLSFKSKKDPTKPGKRDENYSEAETGYALGNIPIQALRVSLTVPIYTVKKKIKVMENGVEKEYVEEVDSIPTLSDLSKLYGQQVKIASVVPIASGQTDQMGNFILDVPISKYNFKIIDNNIKYPPAYTRRALVEGIVIKVNDQRFTDPNWFIFPTEDKTSVFLDENVVQIFDYKLNVSFNTNVQRNYKGKMYLLKAENKLVKGEGDNVVGGTKEVQTISPSPYAFPGKPKFSYSYNTFSVVGVKDISGTVDANKALAVDFNRLAADFASPNSSYTVYFEPDATFDALYFSPQNVSNSTLKTSGFESTVFKSSNAVEKVVMGPKYLSMTITGRYVYNWISPNGKTNTTLPLPEGTSLTLVKGYLSTKSLVEDKGSDLLEKKKIASTTVGKNGAYSFDLGLLNYDSFNDDGGKNMLILVDDPYYASEPTFIAYNQNENIKLPDLKAVVRQFTFSSRLVYEDVDKKLKPANQMDVYLCRIKSLKPLTIPVNEGDPNNKDYFKRVFKDIKGVEYDIIDKTVPDFNGNFTFNRLALPSDDFVHDSYYILAEPQSTSNDNYLTEDPFPLTGVIKTWNLKDILTAKQIFSDATKVLDIVYNETYKYVKVIPQKPYIDGAVYPYSNTATSVLAGVKVELFDMMNVNIPANSTFEQFEAYFNKSKPIDEQITGTNGRFLFEKFADIFPQNIRGKMLRLTKPGFLTSYRPIEDGIPLIKGHRANLGKVYLDLPIDLSAVVMNSNGQGVPSRIIVGDDFSWADTYSIGSAVMAYLKSPKGKVKFTIVPYDQAKYKTTIVELNIDPKKTTNITLTVNSAMHNIGIVVIDMTTQKSIPADIYVTNIKEKAGMERFNMNGTVVHTLEFFSSGSLFDLKIVPTGNYTIAKTQVKSDMTKVVNITVYVEPAVTLTCFASAGTGRDKVSLTDYHIVVDGLDEDEYIVTKRSETLGTLLTKIPYNKWLSIGASMSGYVGQDQDVLTNSPKTLYFTFSAASPITNFYGFPVELTGLGKLTNDTYLASGRLNPAGKAGLSNLTLENKEHWLRFNDIKVKIEEPLLKGLPGQLPSKPKVTILSDLVFDENELDAKLFDDIHASIRDNTGLKIEGSGSSGSLVGRVAIDPASLSAGVFSNVANTVGDGNFLYLNKPDTQYIPAAAIASVTKADKMNTFSTASSDVNTPTMMLSTLSRRLPTFYVVDGFNVVPESKVTISNYGIVTQATVSTTLAYVTNAKDNILKGVFNITSDNFFFTEKQPLKIKLNQWEMEFNDWNITKAGFLGAGSLNALGLTIPFTKLRMTKTALGFGNFDVKKLTLLNKFPININANEVMTSFGYDKGYSVAKGAWSVAILANTQTESLATLSGLPDISKFDNILINSINLYDTGNSNDTRIQLVENHPTVTLNDIAKFKPFSVFGGLDFISFRGNLDLDIPNLSGLANVTYDLKYQIVNNNFVHVHDTPFKNLTFDANGIKVNFSETNQKFSSGTLKLNGILSDKDQASNYEIAVVLDKTVGHTKIVIPEDSPTPQRVYLSGNKSDKSYLDNAVGGMKLTNKVWNNFSFNGDMTGSSGVNASDSKLFFTVKGDIVANDSKIGVQNMDAAGMKGINFTYDFKESALVGSASLQQKADFADLTMDIDLKIKPSGWYIFSNCLANNIKNSPFSQAAVGIMLGEETLTGDQLASLHKHFKDNDIPTNFDNNFKAVKGILMVMSTDIPIPIIPTFNINLDPVAHASLTHGIYGNLYFNAGFSLKKEDLSLVIGARLGAFVKLSVGANMGLACAGVNLHADVHADVSGKLVPFAAPGSRLLLNAGLKFTLDGTAYVGAGICDSNCETPCVDAGFFEICSPIPCFKISLSKKLVLGLEAEVTDLSPYFHFKGMSEL